MTQELTHTQETAAEDEKEARENKYKGWSWCANRHATNSTLDKLVPQVTIKKIGVIYINDAALALIGTPSAVILGFNAEIELIGIQPEGNDRETAGANKFKATKKLVTDTHIALNTANYLKTIGYPVGSNPQFLIPVLEDGRLVLEVGDIIKQAKEDAAAATAKATTIAAATSAAPTGTSATTSTEVKEMEEANLTAAAA
jgi:hypothetical protein